jgi:hypothetical protein
MDTKNLHERLSPMLQRVAEEVKLNQESLAYRCLRVILRPTNAHGTYEFVLENVGPIPFRHLVISRYQLIGPPAFGVDDTFMRNPEDAYPPIVVPRIGPKEVLKLCEEIWRTGDRYHLRSGSLIGVRYSMDEASHELMRANVPFLIVGDVPLQPPEDSRPWHVRQHPQAHALGKATGSFLRALLRKE